MRYSISIITVVIHVHLDAFDDAGLDNKGNFPLDDGAIGEALQRRQDDPVQP
ncbi:MAG: hypothetical protein IPL32_19750 [Chloracidobacterium sp.]|nr:hypothetical protein [Chloracidobacterium sp.]